MNPTIKKIAVRAGHNAQAPGAAGILVEIIENRLLLPVVIQLLRIAGYDVLDVTPGRCSANTDLTYGVRKANEWGADLFVSLHFNKCYPKYEGKIGAEVCVWDTSNVWAAGVIKCLSDLGFRNRGLKIRPDLYELKATRMPAMIIETCFLEATEDIALYQSLGVDKIAQAIVSGISGAPIRFPAEETSPVVPTPPSNPGTSASTTAPKWDYAYDPWVKKIQQYLNARGHNIAIDGQAGDNTYKAIKGYTLSNGERATLARLVQERLNNMGYNCGTPDGIVGVKTYGAINQFQRDNGLGVGYLGGTDWYYLIR